MFSRSTSGIETGPELSLRDRLNQGLAVAGSVLALASGMLVREAVLHPDKAQAEQQCTTETTTTTDGTTTTTTETTHCTDSSDDGSSDQSGSQQPSEPKPDKPDNKHKNGKTHQGKSIHGPKTDKTDSQENFPGYNMEDTAFTDHNGCFVTSAASALRRVTGDAHITPKRIYYPALRSRWTPSGGVKDGAYLFDALPSIARHFDVKVYKIDGPRGAVKALHNGDQVQMLAAPPSHFTLGGHYLDARALTPSGRLILDDPNGKGLHGDSERPNGWSPAQLKAAGIVAYRGLHLITR